MEEVESVESLEKAKWYKNSYLWNIVLIIALMGVQLFIVNLSMDGRMPSMLIGVLLGTSIGSMIKKRKDFATVLVLLAAIVANHFILFRNGIYFPNYIFLFIGLAGMTIQEAARKKGNYMKRKIAFVLALLITFFSLNHIIYGDNLIKDQNFYRAVKKEYDIFGKISEEDLEGIDRLSLNTRYHVNSLEGIEYFKNLTFLSIWDGRTIYDFTSIGKLHKLERLVTWYADIDKVEEMEKMDSVEYLELLYPKNGKLDGLEDYPNLKELLTQGMDFEDLSAMDGPSRMEELHLGVSKIQTFKGIEQLSNLKELHLYEIVSDDWRAIFELDKLQKITIQGGQLANIAQLKEMAKEKGIEVEIIDNNLSKIVID